MAKDREAAPKTKKVRWGRMFAAVIILALLGGGLYVASWLNARRYYLVIGQSEVRVARGRMLPVGYEAYVPNQIELRRAYEPFALPSGINIPRGETAFRSALREEAADERR